MKADKIKKVLIIGGGTMGQQIAAVCVINGFTVAVYDVNSETLENAEKRIGGILRFFSKSNKISEDDIPQALEKISYSSDPSSAAQDAGIVSENLPEDPELKGKVLAEFDKICGPDVVFTTNTSTLLPSMFADRTGRPDRLAALHFHDVRITDIVDVMPHPGTSPETLECVRDFAVKIGQKPIVLKKQSPGYVFNYMLSELFKSAQTLASNGVSSPEDIDRAWMGVMHTPIGPFGIMDSVGLDTVWKITDYWAVKLENPQMKKNADFVKQFVDRGELGQKTGRGFYSYPGPAFSDPEFMKKDFS